MQKMNCLFVCLFKQTSSNKPVHTNQMISLLRPAFRPHAEYFAEVPIANFANNPNPRLVHWMLKILKEQIKTVV